MSLQRMSDTDFADYLERVGGDYAESGNEATAEDYQEAARRIRTLAPAPRDVGYPVQGAAPTWERITADQVRVGDRIAKTRNEEPVAVMGLGTVGPNSRWLILEGGRIRPRHTAKFWRLG
jgi:hypothetical protein